MIAEMRGASASTERGVNAWVTRDRSWRCRGGSVLTRLAAKSCPVSEGLFPPIREENAACSDKTRCTSS